MKQSAVQSDQLVSYYGITYTSAHGSVGTDHRLSLLAMEMAHYMLSVQRSDPCPLSMLTHSDSLLVELRLRFRFRSSLLLISPEQTHVDSAAYIHCRSPNQSN